MKGFPEHVEGPLGPWYQKVNAAIRQADDAGTAKKLRQLLGEPDELEHVPDEDRRESEDAPIEANEPAEIWTYVDLYRPRVRYEFGVTNGRILCMTRVTLTD